MVRDMVNAIWAQSQFVFTEAPATKLFHCFNLRRPAGTRRFSIASCRQQLITHEQVLITSSTALCLLSLILLFWGLQWSCTSWPRW